jgi:AP-4 complex subunit epsilon-1
MREYLIRAIYCDMLGSSVDFLHASAMLFAQQPTLSEKAIGYLSSSLIIEHDSELILMFTNTLKRDIESANLVENCIALTQIPHLTTPDMVPVLVASVRNMLAHSKPIVRKKAILALKHLHSLDSTLTTDETCSRLVKLLGDSDVGVVAASVAFLQDIAQTSTAQVETAVAPLCAVLQRLAAGSFPAECIVRNLPAPFLQISIIRLLVSLIQSGSKFAHHSTSQV